MIKHLSLLLLISCWFPDTAPTSIGSGLRYALNQEQKLNIRIDVGYGREGSNFYIVIGEAF